MAIIDEWQSCMFVVKSSESTKLTVDEHVDIDDGE